MKRRIIAPITAKMMLGIVNAPTPAAAAPVPGKRAEPSQPPTNAPKIPRIIVARMPPP
jgi:hypothetical protein